MSEDKQIIKKGKKIIIGEDEHPVDEDMSIDELLEVIRENPAYAGASEDNIYKDEDGNIEVSRPKSATNGVNL